MAHDIVLKSLAAKTTQQKRIPRGHTGGGRWTKGSAPPSIKNNKTALAAYNATRDATSARVKLYKMKRNLASATGAQKSVLQKKVAKQAAIYNNLNARAKSLRKSAASQGYKINASGKVVSVPKLTAAQNPSNATVKQVKQSSRKTSMPPQHSKSSNGQSMQQQIDDGIDAFKEYRRLRVKAIQLSKKAVKSNNANILQQYQQVVQKRDTAKSKFDNIRKALNSTGTVKFKSNGDVIVNGVQTHKGGKAVGVAKKTTSSTSAKQTNAQQNATKNKLTSTPKPGVTRNVAPSPQELSAMRKRDIAKMVQDSHVWKLLDSSKFSNAGNNIRSTKELLAQIHSDFGLDEKPKVVNKLSTRRTYKKVVYRGVVGMANLSTSDMVRQFKYGNMFMGLGVFGNGTYAAARKKVAGAYANGDQNGVMQIGIPKDAKYIDYKELRNITYRVNFNKPTKSGLPGIARNALFKRSPELVALALGYDGIRVDGGMTNNGDYYVIFNRGQLDVKK